MFSTEFVCGNFHRRPCSVCRFLLQSARLGTPLTLWPALVSSVVMASTMQLPAALPPPSARLAPHLACNTPTPISLDACVLLDMHSPQPLHLPQQLASSAQPAHTTHKAAVVQQPHAAPVLTPTSSAATGHHAFAPMATTQTPTHISAPSVPLAPSQTQLQAATHAAPVLLHVSCQLTSPHAHAPRDSLLTTPASASAAPLAGSQMLLMLAAARSVRCHMCWQPTSQAASALLDPTRTTPEFAVSSC